MAKFRLPAHYNDPTGWFGGHLFVNGVTEVAPAQAGLAGELLKRYYSVTEAAQAEEDAAEAAQAEEDAKAKAKADADQAKADAKAAADQAKADAKDSKKS